MTDDGRVPDGTGLSQAEPVARLGPSGFDPSRLRPCVNGVRTMLLHGSVRHDATSPRGHPADGMTAHVEHGGGAVSTIIDPRSFEDGGPEWVMRYGDPESIRFTVASLLASYDYLLSGSLTQREATQRLMLMRRARAAIATEARRAETGTGSVHEGAGPKDIAQNQSTPRDGVRANNAAPVNK